MPGREIIRNIVSQIIQDFLAGIKCRGAIEGLDLLPSVSTLSENISFVEGEDFGSFKLS